MAGKTPEEVNGLAYRGVEFALSPNATQRNLLESNAGAARFAYNWALDEIKGEYALWGERQVPQDGLHALRTAQAVQSCERRHCPVVA
jgi:hypothetical protein